MHFHVVLPDHFEFFLVFGVSALNNKLVGENIGQLGAITIPSTDNSLFVVVVVAAGKEMAEDELGDVYFMLSVDDDGDSFTIVHDSDVAFFLVDFHVELVHFFIALVVVSGVDEYFIKDLVESGGVSDLFACESGVSFLEDPLLLLAGLYGTDVGVRTEEDVFERGFLLVDFLDCFFLLHLSQLMFIKANSNGQINNWLISV